MYESKHEKKVVKQSSLKKWNKPNIVELEVKKTKSGSIIKRNENTKNNHSGL